MLQQKQHILWLLFIVLWSSSYCRQYTNTGDDSISRDISQDEVILYNMVNDMRRQAKLPHIPLSNSLSFVARTHINDLIISRPADKNCGPNSWSSAGKWTPCCDKKNAVTAKCMRSKPTEITGYQGNGYELIYWGEDPATPSDAAAMWQQVAASEDMILCRGRWKGFQWKAIGIGIREGYAVMWLGDKPESSAELSPIAAVHSVSKSMAGKFQPFQFITNSKNFPISKPMFPFVDQISDLPQQPQKEEVSFLNNLPVPGGKLLNKDGQAVMSDHATKREKPLQNTINAINSTVPASKQEENLASEGKFSVDSAIAISQGPGIESYNTTLSSKAPEAVVLETNTKLLESNTILQTSIPQPLSLVKPEQNSKDVKTPKAQASEAVSQEISQKELSTNPNSTDTIPLYYVIVSSVKTAAGAQTELKRAKSKGHPEAFILEGTAVYRIALGSYKTNKLASMAAKELMKTFPGSWIMKQ